MPQAGRRREAMVQDISFASANEAKGLAWPGDLQKGSPADPAASHPSSRRPLSTETCSSIMIAWAVRSAAPKRQSAASISEIWASCHYSKPTSCWP